MQPTHFEFKRHLISGGKVALRIPFATKKAPISQTTSLEHELVSVRCDSIRGSFYNLLRKHKQQIENEYSVKCTIDKNDKNVSLRIYGKNSDQAMGHSLQLCLDSKVYNFYLCLPVMGKTFNKELDEFKANYQDKFVGAKWETRPHVTLKMLNIVTNQQLAFTNNLLTTITKQIQLKSTFIEPVCLELSALDIFEERGKNAYLPLFVHTTLNNPIDGVSKQLIDAVSNRYCFKNEIIKHYTTITDFEDESEMIMDDGSLYIHSYDAKNDIVASSQSTATNAIKEHKNDQCDYIEQQNKDDPELQFPHVTLIRYKNYKDAIGLQGPRTGLVITCELRPRHGETTWPYTTMAGDSFAFSYNLLHHTHDEQ